MKIFKDTNNKVHVIDSNFTHLLPSGCVEITQEEAEQIRLANQPVPTLSEQAEAVRHALQEAIDAKAQSFSFSNGNALMLYAGFTNPFQPLAQQFATWDASVWFEADNYKDQVIDGTKPMLTPDEAVALMPAYPA